MRISSTIYFHHAILRSQYQYVHLCTILDLVGTLVLQVIGSAALMSLSAASFGRRAKTLISLSHQKMA